MREDAINIDKDVEQIGREVFNLIGEHKTSAFNKNYWTRRILEWSMRKKEFKISMFRLVDVLPVLKSSKAIAQHVKAYLSDSIGEFGSFFKWGVSSSSFTGIKDVVIALAVKEGVKQMAGQFIAGESAAKAKGTLKRLLKSKMQFTVDLLGEYCVSEKEAANYLNRYMEAIDTLSLERKKWANILPVVEGHRAEEWPINISVKLSALYSQCYPLNFKKSVEVLSERLAQIAKKAKEHECSLYVDAEDTAHNPMIYEAFKRVFSDKEFSDFVLPGIVIQAYLRDAESILNDLVAFAKERGSPIAIRLVKGAYWDIETVLASQNGWEPPVFQVKESSDANYEKLSEILIDNAQYVLPAFGSHNIRSLSYACALAKNKGLSNKDFELQMLYGMAEPIALAYISLGYLVRMYVPLGELIPGMGYLVRRLLENTSNESFLRHTFFDEEQVDALLRRPEFKD